MRFSGVALPVTPFVHLTVKAKPVTPGCNQNLGSGPFLTALLVQIGPGNCSLSAAFSVGHNKISR